ncbi:MAG: immunoglobulin-like domain-containing protein [Thomasclavelia ramosa]
MLNCGARRAALRPLDYVASVNDNYSKLKKEDITFEGNVDTNQQGKFTFQYNLKDSSNNKTTATLNVTVKEKPKPVNQSPNTNNSNPTKTNQTTQHQQQSNKPKPSNKVFYIRDYNYDIASCKNAAVSYMDSQLHSTSATYGELQPYQENGTTVGYKVVFR